MMMSKQMTSSKLVNPIQTGGGGLVLEPSSRRKMNNFKTVQVMTTTLSSNIPGNIFKVIVTYSLASAEAPIG